LVCEKLHFRWFASLGDAAQESGKQSATDCKSARAIFVFYGILDDEYFVAAESWEPQTGRDGLQIRAGNGRGLWSFG